MIETIQAQTTVGLPFGTPFDIAMLNGLDVAGWKRGRNGSWVKQAPRRTTIALEQVALGPNKGNTVLRAKGNLPRLLHGEGAESFTLPPHEVWQGCQSLVVAVQAFAPWASSDLSDWRVNRVDANLTMECQDEDATSWIAGARGYLASLDPEVSSYGAHSHRAKVTQLSELAVYSKTIDSGTRGPRDGHLVRVEDRVFGRKARQEYGDHLDDVAREGADVARNRLEAWMTRLSVQLTAASVEEVAKLLMRQGMDASNAFRLAGAAQVIAAKGVPGLTDCGVNRATAYRWKSVIESYLTVEAGGVVLTWDDVAYAATGPVRGD